ncbi:hypothetical protein ACPA9J_04990 [Pseudomonas aeruginosa]
MGRADLIGNGKHHLVPTSPAGYRRIPERPAEELDAGRQQEGRQAADPAYRPAATRQRRRQAVEQGPAEQGDGLRQGQEEVAPAEHPALIAGAAPAARKACAAATLPAVAHRRSALPRHDLLAARA